MHVEEFFPTAEKLVLEKNIKLYDPEKSRQISTVYYINNGLLCLRSTSFDGNAYILLFQRAPRFANFFPLIRNKIEEEIQAPHFIFAPQVTFTKCEAVKIPAEEFLHKWRACDDFKRIIIQQAFDDYVELLQSYISKMEDGACTRLCKLLMDLSSPYDKGRRKLETYFTYTTLSEYLGIHPVTVSKLMKKLHQYGYISRDGRKVYIEKEEAIRQLIDARIEIDYH